MNANSPKTSALEVNRKNLLVLAGIAFCAGALWGGWHYLTHPPRAWIVRWQVMRYLRKNSTTANFKVDFAFPSKAEMAKAPPKTDSQGDGTGKGKLTGKDFDTLAGEYIRLKTAALSLEHNVPAAETEKTTLKFRQDQLAKDLAIAKAASSTNTSMLETRLSFVQRRLESLEKTLAARPELEAKEKELAPILSDLWDFQRAWAAELQLADATDSKTLAGARARLTEESRQKIAIAQSYGAIYKVVGQELWVTERLLGSANPEHRRAGLTLAMEAGRVAAEDAQNGWLAGCIVQGYVWPNLDVATDSNRRSPLNRENVLGQCAGIFRDNEDFAGLVRNYEMLLALAKTPQQMDQARVQIAMAYQQAGNFDGALSYLRQVQATNDFRWAVSRIPWLERQVRTTR
jgi:hypothetical protein